MTTTHFGRRLRQLRIDRGFSSQAQLAEHLGVAAKTVCRHEASPRPPRPTDRTLQAYLRVLRVDEAYLLHGVGDPPKVFRVLGKRIPPNVERFIATLEDGGPIEARIRAGLLAFDWAAAGWPDPSDYEVRSLANVLEGWAQK